MCKLFSFSLACILLQIQIAVAALRPVVVIPGTMGSKLCGPSETTIWGDRASYTKDRIATLRIPFDSNPELGGIRSCGFIETVNVIPILWESDVYSGILNYLGKIGYSKEDILVFHYDWRLSNFENASRLRNEIEGRLKLPSDKVDVVAHSMGGIIARIYIQSFGGEARVQNLLMLGTPHLGSAKTFQYLKDGFDHWFSEFSGGQAEIQRTMLSFPAIYQLMPTYDQCCGMSENADPVQATYVDILSPATWAKFQWLPSEFKTGPGLEFLLRSLAEARRLKELMRQPIFRDPTAYSRLHFVANGFMDTWSRVFFSPADGRITGHAVSPGDGTVLLFSATNSNPAQVQISLKDHAHVFIGREPELVIKATLTGEKFHKGPGSFSQWLTDANNEKIEVTSASLEVSPRVVRAGQLISISLALSGTDLQRAKLPALRAQLIQDEKVLETKQLVETSNGTYDRALQQQFHAPSEPGAYSMQVDLPGIETFGAIFAVLGD